ncbi:MAG: DUF3109 family protein [Polyangiales bacterium]
MGRKLTVLNAESATFSCVYPTCGGACCKGSRPPATPAEVAHLRALLPRVKERLRPSARRAIETRDFVTRRLKSGNATLAVQDGACVFFHDGCTLHVLAVEEGLDRFAHKPWACTIFPLERHDEGTWHIRQHGAYGEAWDELPCLSPDASDARGIHSLAPELAFAAELATGGRESWRFAPPRRRPSPLPPSKPAKVPRRGARPTDR